jgi:response regulator of citrate/malate metabolism
MAREMTDGFEILPLPTYRTSAKEFAEKAGVDYAVAQGFIKYLVSQGFAKEVEKRKVVGAKGKPTNVYELPTELRLKLAA